MLEVSDQYCELADVLPCHADMLAFAAFGDRFASPLLFAYPRYLFAFLTTEPRCRYVSRRTKLRDLAYL